VLVRSQVNHGHCSLEQTHLTDCSEIIFKRLELAKYWAKGLWEASRMVCTAKHASVNVTRLVLAAGRKPAGINGKNVLADEVYSPWISQRA
jgi:hypothetical protein